MDRKDESKGHPLPRSGEARHNEIPEHLENQKGGGDDPAALVQPRGDPVTPEGEPYRYGDLGRGPGSEADETDAVNKAGKSDEFARDQAAHQDRGQSVAKSEKARR